MFMVPGPQKRVPRVPAEQVSNLLIAGSKEMGVRFSPAVTADNFLEDDSN
jgi:hypothetical protein